MEKMRIPDLVNLTSDSEDLVDEYWFTSPGASFDGSSVNSIPWADDVIKKNQEIWERVERMFYGEEPLPNDDQKLRNEIVEWTTHFPYLRVTGVQMPMYFSSNAIASDPNYEETFAVHPPERRSGANRTDDRYRRLHDDSFTQSLADNIEKCLRITSGPLLSRRTQNTRTAYGVRNMTSNRDTNYPQSTHNKQEPKSALVSVRSNYDTPLTRQLYGSIDVDRLHSVPYSARFIKVPLMKGDVDEFGSMTVKKPNLIRIKTATLVPISRPLRNSITLPAINIEPKYFDRSTSDAISALIYQNTSTPSTYFPLRTKKRSESE